MSSLSQILHTISYMGLPLLFAMVLHEYAHGWMAEKCGDSTAKLQGRLTINPLAHIDPFGTVILPLICLMLPGSFLLGWAKPVPINPGNMHQPRRDMALTAAAGPGMNLLLAVASALLLALILTPYLDGGTAASTCHGVSQVGAIRDAHLGGTDRVRQGAGDPSHDHGNLCQDLVWNHSVHRTRPTPRSN